MLGKAIQIAASAHEDQKDKGGNAYILHPLWVMNNVRHLEEDYMIVAILHDVVEDTSWTIEELRDEGFSEEILDALKLLDMRGHDYNERIKQIALNKIARAVKIKDIEHNSKITRLKGIRKKDYDRMQKYLQAYLYLKD